MATTNPVVTCTVDQCTHYMTGDQCMAAKISVYNDEQTGSSRTLAIPRCRSFHHRKTMGDMVGAFHNANWGGDDSSFHGWQANPPNVECFVVQAVNIGIQVTIVVLKRF